MDYKNTNDLWFVMIPLLLLVVVWLGTNKKNKIISVLKLKVNYRFKIVKSFLLVVGLALIFYALLGPQREIGITEVKGEGLDIYVLIDTSKSMLAEDIVPSRMTRSKKVVEELLKGLGGDRIGFIPYASSAYIQMPLTDDYGLASMFLNVIDTDMIGGGGTDVAQAIGLAADSFKETGSSNQVMLILSDGEEADVDMKQIDKLIKDSGMKIYTIGIGTLEGGLIPIYGNDGVTVTSYKKDENDQLVMTRLEESLLQSIANKSDGKYYRSSVGLDELQELIKDLSVLDKAESSSRKIREYRQLFQWFLGAGIVCLLLSFSLPERRTKG